MKKILLLFMSIILVSSLSIFADDAPVLPDETSSMNAGTTSGADAPAGLMPEAPAANGSLPDMSPNSGDSGAFPGDTNTFPGDTVAASSVSNTADAGTIPQETAQGSNVNATAPPEMGAMPGDTDFPGGSNDISAAPAGKEDANVMFSGDMKDQKGAQAKASAPGSSAVKKPKAAEHAGIPSYKAVPMTNELRIMDKKSGKLGQTESLKRYMGWATESSSQMKDEHNPINTEDLNAYTAWVVNKGDDGLGEYLKLVFDPIYFASIQEGEVSSVKITGLKIINGYNKSHDDWFNNARVRTMKIYHNKTVFCNIELYDTTNWQEIFFKKPMIIKPGDTMKAVITDYFEGYKYPNACITEFLPVGKPNGTVVGADYMNGKSKMNVRNGGMYD